MAFGIKQIAPIDTKPGTAVGIALPFVNPGVFKSTYTTADAIKYNLINYFLTNKGDRYENPLFGGDLRKYIFEQIDGNTFDTIKEDIQTKIQTLFPQVELREVNIKQTASNTDTNQILVEIQYSIANTGVNDNLQMVFS